MNAQFERSENLQEWYTPSYIIKALTKEKSFDLDPCAGINTTIAEENWTELNAFTKQWYGRVFLNPPYKHPVVEKFIHAMIQHNHGIALLFNRFDSVLWQEQILPTASSLFLIKGRLKFIRPSGVEGGTPGTGSSLVSWGSEDADILSNLTIPGFYIRLR